MDAESVLEVWEDVDTDCETDVSQESDEDVAAQELEGDYSDGDTTAGVFASPGPSSSTVRPARSSAEYDWQQITEGR